MSIFILAVIYVIMAAVVSALAIVYDKLDKGYINNTGDCEFAAAMGVCWPVMFPVIAILYFSLLIKKLVKHYE